MQRSGIEGPCITPTTVSATRSMAAASVASMQRSGIEGPRITPTTVSAVRSMAAANVASMQRSGIEGPCITPTAVSAIRSVAAANVASMQRSGIEGPRITPTTVSAVRSMAAANVASMQRSGIEGPCITPTTASAVRSVAAANVASMERSGIEGPRITPTTASAVRSMAAGAWSWLRHRSRLAAAIAMRGLLSRWVSCVSPLTLQRYAFKPLSEFHLAFGVCRLDEWGHFSRAKFLTDSLDSTSLHRGYVRYQLFAASPIHNGLRTQFGQKSTIDKVRRQARHGCAFL